MSGVKRKLFLVHRWLGILLCLFMAFWFLSGVVMMYVGYPKLTQQERLQYLPGLAGDGCCITAQAALAALPPGVSPQGLRLTTTGSGPVYIVTLGKNRFSAVNARTGVMLSVVDEALALESAARFAPGLPVYYRGEITEDAWTHSRALDGHRPLHVVEVGEKSMLLYISGATGEVVRDASLTERRWNWIGAWLHWLYPLRGGGLDAWWTEIVIYLSLASTTLAVVGLWLGILRWRKRCYANGSHSPYRAPLARWHHWSGLAFGVLVVTWIFSGLMSMNPWKIFESGSVLPLRPLFQVSSAGLDSAEQLACLQNNDFEAVELNWARLGEAGFVVARNVRGESRLQPETYCAPMDQHAFSALEAAATLSFPGIAVSGSEIQQAYDWHYYAREVHTMSGHQERPLPVLRVRFADAAETWLYIDPRSGAVVQRSDRLGRVKRVLFAFLHSWDWAPLLAKRPLWDMLMIFFSLGGFIVSISGVLLGWRRLVCRG